MYANIFQQIFILNEQNYIQKCLKSLDGIADEVLVVDSFSNDNTILLAKPSAICGRHEFPVHKKSI